MLWGIVVMDLLEEKGFIPPEFVENETKWFYSSLGIDGESLVLAETWLFRIAN